MTFERQRKRKRKEKKRKENREKKQPNLTSASHGFSLNSNTANYQVYVLPLSQEQ